MDEGKIVYRFDGSFAGLLCAAGRAAGGGFGDRAELGFAARESGCGLFDAVVDVECSRRAAREIWIRHSGPGRSPVLRACFEAYCSDMPEKDLHAGRVLAALFRGERLSMDALLDPDILHVSRASARSRSQAHKISGLVRFSELPGGIWYAGIAPDCDVLPLVAGHFSHRFGFQDFMLHDLRRSKALLNRTGSGCRMAEGISLPEDMTVADLPCTETEALLRRSWARYFDSIAIAERKNRRLQASHMPAKYRDYLPETGGTAVPSPPIPGAADPPHRLQNPEF